MCKTSMCVCAYGCQCLSVVQHKGNSVWCVSRQTHIYTNSRRHIYRSDRLYTCWIVVWVSESLHLQYNVCVCIYLCMCMYVCMWMDVFVLFGVKLYAHWYTSFSTFVVWKRYENQFFCCFASFKKFQHSKKIVFTSSIFHYYYCRWSVGNSIPFPFNFDAVSSNILSKISSNFLAQFVQYFVSALKCNQCKHKP